MKKEEVEKLIQEAVQPLRDRLGLNGWPGWNRSQKTPKENKATRQERQVAVLIKTLEEIKDAKNTRGSELHDVGHIHRFLDETCEKALKEVKKIGKEEEK
jgi:hypothetical protein